MIGLGTIVNVGAVVAAGFLGVLLKGGIKERFQSTIMGVLGISTMFIGAAGTLQEMFVVGNGSLSTQGTMLLVLSLIIGAFVAYAFGYRTAADVATIAAGATTFVVGPVTGAAVGASDAVIAISIAVGVFKSIAVMLITPLVAKKIGLNTPRAAMVFGGLMGTTSGTTSGLAATDPKLVPYGAMTSTFYTGMGCLLCPTVLYFLVKIFLP